MCSRSSIRTGFTGEYDFMIEWVPKVVESPTQRRPYGYNRSRYAPASKTSFRERRTRTMSIQTDMDDALTIANDYSDAVDKFYDKVAVTGYDWGAPTAQEFAHVMDNFADWLQKERKV